ncbi:putative calcium-binding protein CML36 [Silene latifolia]|uniref:putative calcium-binding protein CML36 n=1 Tax=Silene latifolia TaxID=37657 RepID=UPI003D778204
MKQFFKSIKPNRLFRSKKSSLKSPPQSNSPSSSSSSSSSSSDFKFDVVSAFKLLDRDNNGKIDRYELNSVFNSTLSDDELREMIMEVDIDGDGFVTLDELQAVGSIFESTVHEEEDELRAAFEFFDFNSDGGISAEELFLGFQKIGDDRCTLEDCRRMIEEVDANKDGFVCFHEFSRMMNVVPR